MSQPLGDPALCHGQPFHGFLRVDLQISPVKLQPRLCRGHAFYGFLRVDLQISPVKSLPVCCARCVLQCFVQVEAYFCRDVSANSATAFLVHLRFTVLLRFAVRQFCELDTSTCASTAFWLSCTFVPCNSHAIGEGQVSKTHRLFDVDVSQAQNCRELVLPNVNQA